MKIVVFFLIVVVSTENFAQYLPNRQAKEIAQRRQLVSYSANVLHHSPEYSDQVGESSVKVSFDTKPTTTKSSQYYNPIRTRAVDYSQQQPITASNYGRIQPQTQLFNVGYSVKFTNDQTNLRPQPVPTIRSRPNLDEGEIITGVRKQNEEVQVPDFNFTPQDFVSSALIENKKAKLSGIKPKNKYNPGNIPNPKILLNQAHLSPATQKQYKALQQLKLPVQNQQDIPQKYLWRNLSPNVEIIQSTEVPVRANKPKYVKPDPSTFDHLKVLGRSQDFDFSNAIDNTQQYTQNTESRQVPVPVRAHPMILPLTQIPSNVVLGKLPVDTSLLHEPVHLDTRLIQAAMRQNQYVENTPTQQQYQTFQPQSEVINFNQNHDEDKGYQDFQQSQNRYTYKIYGKPQPVEAVQRQPRYAEEYNLQTDLRPPPLGSISPVRYHTVTG